VKTRAPNDPRVASALLAGVLLGVLGACGDPGTGGAAEADREYAAFLRGDEDGSTPAERAARLDRAIGLAPDRADLLESRIVFRIDARDFSGARADADRAIALADRPYLRFLRALVACRSGGCGAGLPDLDAAIAGQPENVQFRIARALARSQSGAPAGGLEDAQRGVALAPRQAKAWYARGVALEALGRSTDAIEDFDTAVRLRPELVYPLRARADAYERLGDVAHAASDRAAADAKALEVEGCGDCSDPFHY
jgi:tetratricopeptide (TPR) repeat protein